MIRLPAAICMFLMAAPLAAQSYSPLPNGISVEADGTGMRVEAIEDGILRVRIARGPLPRDESWAVVPARREPVAIRQGRQGFSTGKVAVRIEPDLRLTVTDSNGKTIVADAAPPDVRGTAFSIRKAMPTAEYYYGMGDKSGPLDRRGGSFTNWNIDAWGFGSATDPIYKSIPFYVATGGDGGAYGLFLDNHWRSWFDFGHRNEDVLEFGAADGPIDYFIIAGRDMGEVVRQYAGLTGRAPMPPGWAFGYQQSRYSYMSDTEVRGIAARLRRDRIPTDVIWLDIDFQDRNRPFTVNRSAFPDMRKLAGDLSADGIRLVAITDLHVAHAPDQGYAPFDSGTAGDHFLKTRDGKTYVAPVWPGPSVFPDFSQATTRRWWGDQYRQFVDDGIAGFWNDMNEPAIFETPTKTMPLDTIHRIEEPGFVSRTALHAEMHNVYGMLNSRATYEGMKRLRPDERPFVMTRATYAGGQRYAVTWTGDNSSSWDHLKLSVNQLLNLGLSGFTYAGADVGGFIGGASPDLLTRWYQVAAFTPIFRNHAANNAPRSEPWVDGDKHLALRRRAIEERYRLLPYFSLLADAQARLGDPLIRPVSYDYADSGCDRPMSFTLGGRLLVAASPEPESPQAYDVCLPGGGWYDYWTGQPVETRKETPTIDRLPVFVRAGTILARQPLVQSSSETPSGPLELHVYPGADCAGDLYFDDGKAVPQRLRQSLRCSTNADGIRLDFGKREGQWKPWWKELAIYVHGTSEPVKPTIVRDRAIASSLTVPRP